MVKSKAPQDTSMQSTVTKPKQSSHDIYMDREYYACGCAYIVDVKSGAASFSFPCLRHKIEAINGSIPEK